MAANLNVFKTSLKNCILSKSNSFWQKFNGDIYIESDEKKQLTLWAL